MKIVQVCPRYYPYAGGVEKFVKTLTEELIRVGFEVTVFATEPRLKKPHVKKLIDGVELHLFNSYAFAEIGYLSPMLLRALKEVKEGIIHAHGYRSFPMLEAALAKGMDVKLVVTTHLGFSKVGELAYKIYNPLFGNLIFSKANKIIVVSPAEVEKIPLLRKFRHKISYIPIGIQIPSTEFNEARYFEDKLSMLYVGRIEKRKGMDSLLRLMSILDEDKFSLTIVGSGPYAKQLVDTLDRLKLSNVRFMGKVSERSLQELYQKSTIFLLLSEYEGHSVALTEAIAHGLVPVVTDVGGNRYVLGDAGFLVEHPCDVGKVSSILYDLYRNREKLVTRSIKARVRAQKLFNINKIVDRYISIYKDLQN